MISTYTTLNDSDLKTRIGIAFATRPRIARHDVQVAVRDGIVTLRGNMPTPYDRQLVVALTQHVAGVFGIEDLLQVTEPSRTRISNETLASTGIARLRLHRVGRIGLATIAITLATLAGCGHGDASRVPVHPTTGAIKFRGQPVSGAFVSLHPRGDTSTGVPSPRATVGPDGNFALSTYDGQDGAPAGDYVLTVQWFKPIRQGNDLVGGPNVLPRKYASANTSDLIVKIAAGENRLVPIQIR
jgi:hypothetical protein